MSLLPTLHGALSAMRHACAGVSTAHRKLLGHAKRASVMKLAPNVTLSGEDDVAAGAGAGASLRCLTAAAGAVHDSSSAATSCAAVLRIRWAARRDPWLARRPGLRNIVQPRRRLAANAVGRDADKR